MITTPLPYVGPLLWHSDWWPGNLRPHPCLGRGCRIWLRWDDDPVAPYLIQHGGDPHEPPTEAVLEMERGTGESAAEEWLRVCDWAEAVHAYEAATARGAPVLR